MSKITEYYSKYIGDDKAFNLFNNEVINMPRDNFVDIGITKIINLSFYFLLSKDSLENNPVSYKEILKAFKNNVEKLGNNEISNRDFDFEDKYLKFNDLDTFYESINGRMFRHIMGIALFFWFNK